MGCYEFPVIERLEDGTYMCGVWQKAASGKHCEPRKQ